MYTLAQAFRTWAKMVFKVGIPKQACRTWTKIVLKVGISRLRPSGPEPRRSLSLVSESTGLQILGQDGL